MTARKRVKRFDPSVPLQQPQFGKPAERQCPVCRRWFAYEHFWREPVRGGRERFVQRCARCIRNYRFR